MELPVLTIQFVNSNSILHMTKLFQFYMSIADEGAFLNTLLESQVVVVYPTYFPADQLFAIDAKLLVESVEKEEFSMLSIVNVSIPPKIVICSAGKGRQVIDTTNSDVVSWTRWKIKSSDGKKDPGTLWFDETNDRCKNKQREFLDWANSILRKVKKSYHRSADPRHFGRYFGPDAWEQFKAGNFEVAEY